MKFFKKLLGLDSSSGFNIKYDRQEDKWLVYKADRIMYLGSKEACEVYLSNIAER